MRDLPRGTVTFLFTDIEGSTRLLKDLRNAYGELLKEHQRLLRDAFEAAGGQEIDTQGDSFFVAFPRAKDAVSAAVAAQSALSKHRWPRGALVRVRMGLHTGEPTVGDERYVGMGVHKAARIGAAAHGGQILLSNTTRGLVEDELALGTRLIDLGEHALKDIDLPERIFQLNAPGLPHRFPPLHSEPSLPGARLGGGVPTRRRRALIASAASVALVAAVVGIAIELSRDDPWAFTGTNADRTASGPTEPGRDPKAIVPGQSIGAVSLGMPQDQVRNLYGNGSERQWRSRGRAGDRVIHSGPAGALTVSYYDGRVVQVATSSPYYTTDDGVRVGVPTPAFNTRTQLRAALQTGEVVEIKPGVYTWKNFVVDFDSGLCLRDEDAATQLTPRVGPSDRIGGILITDARFLAYLPAQINSASGPATPTVTIFCDTQPLEP